MKLLLCFVLLEYVDVGEGCECAADDGSDKEQPVITDCIGCEKGRAKASCRVDRGAGHSDSEKMDQGQSETDKQAAYVGKLRLGGHNKNDKHKDEGQNDLNGERSENGISAVHDAVGTVGAKVTDKLVKIQEMHKAGNGCTCKLCNTVSDKVNERKLAVKEHCDRYGRVDVTARNVTDGVGHSNNYQTEGESCCNGVCAGNDGSTAGNEYQHKGADKLCYVLFDVKVCVHIISSFFVRQADLTIIL